MIARVLRIPEWLDVAMREHADQVSSNWHDIFVFALVRYIEVVTLVRDIVSEGGVEVLTFNTQWVVDVKQHTRDTFTVCLREVKELSTGMIATGRQTPSFAFDLLHSSYESSAERIRKSLAIMDAEELFRANQESLMIAAQFTEELRDLLGGEEVGEESSGS